MSELVVHDYSMGIFTEASSPFDALKLDGQEVWSARDLMPYLGYVEWRKFEGAIERARIAAKNSGAGQGHFVGAAKVIKSGRWGESTVGDINLTRYGAYLVAMNGDPRKPEIAAAQTYFAAKTREAEVAKPLAGPELLASALIEANRVLEAREMLISRQSQDLALAAPKVDFYDKFVDASGSMSMNNAAKILGVGQNTLFELLRNADVLMDGGPNHNTPYAKYAQHFDVVPYVVTHGDGSEHVSKTTRVRASGIPFAAKKLGLILP